MRRGCPRWPGVRDGRVHRDGRGPGWPGPPEWPGPPGWPGSGIAGGSGMARPPWSSSAKCFNNVYARLDSLSVNNTEKFLKDGHDRIFRKFLVTLLTRLWSVMARNPNHVPHHGISAHHTEAAPPSLSLGNQHMLSRLDFGIV